MQTLSVQTLSVPVSGDARPLALPAEERGVEDASSPLFREGMAAEGVPARVRLLGRLLTVALFLIALLVFVQG
jgi:hypothetical protein